MATIVFKRTNEYQNALRKIGIYVDGGKIGEIGNGEIQSFEIPSGMRKVVAKIDWCRSQEFIVDLNKNSAKTILIGSNYSVFFALFSTTLGRNNYLRLSEIS